MRPYRAIPIDKPINSGEFVYGWYVKVFGHHYIYDDSNKEDWEGEWGGEGKTHELLTKLLGFVEVHPSTVGQQVGLPDKNKKEIYENAWAEKTFDGGFDGSVVGIVKFKPTKGYYLDCSHKKQTIVKTHFDGFGYDEDEVVVKTASLTCSEERIEVIGTIHSEAKE